MGQALKNVLYVEDDETIAQIVVMTLEELGGFHVHYCDCGQKALDSVVDEAPQLILMDVMMPGMSGVETLENLARMPQARHIPVVFMTAKAQTHEQETYRQLGVVGVIVKPFDPLTLASQVEQYWQQGRVH